MTRSIRLRSWQRRALDRLDAVEGRDFLAVATPGAGKTTFALTALRQRLARIGHVPVVVVAPTAHLKTQWSQAARRFDLVLDDQWKPSSASLPRDVHGIVTTYQQVASSAPRLATLARGGLVVLDEVHHAGEERAWGDAIRTAFADAAWRLSLSGTPFRSDTNAIPFVRYALDEALPDFEYGYGDALGDARVVRLVEFPSLNGDMEWISPDGTLRRASFDEPLDPAAAAQRLRTALSPEGDWLPTVIDSAHRRLLDLRRSIPDAAGLVIAIDQDHAKAIGELIRTTHGASVVVATSDDQDASTRIARFAKSNDQWLVAVRMVSEGVDIPRLTVGVYATTTTTELFFRQAVGRLVRWRVEDGSQPAWLFLPDDRRLRARAADIAAVRRHHLRNARPVSGLAPEPRTVDPTEQLSLFAALSATPVGAVAEGSGIQNPLEARAQPEDNEFLLELPPLPGVGLSDRTEDTEGAGVTPSRRAHLRKLNAARTADLVHFANMSHAKVNAELNRLTGIRRITEATEAELQRRLEVAERWLRS